MPRATFFVERRETLRVTLRQGSVEEHSERDVGYGVTEREGPSASHRWWDAGALPVLPELVRGRSEALLDGRAPDTWEAPAFTALAHELEALGRQRGSRLDVTVRGLRQRVLCADDVREVEDVRQVVWLELRARVEREGTARTALGEWAFETLEALQSAAAVRAPGWVEDVVGRARAKLDEQPCPRGALTVVLPPGSDAGVFFHEVCGHPMEGDVVSRQASFLARKRGERVAADFLTVADDPTEGSGGVGYRFDDEGTPARPVTLVREGRVDAPLLDGRTAEVLGLEPNGHGRRIDYRHLALPRMSHTVVRPHEGDLESILSGVEEGLLVSYLTPRHVHLLGGEFCFHIPEAREIRHGKLGAFVRPGLLRGHAAEALASIDAVGADSRTFFGLKGCGKLDQGGLPVSFGLPTVRFSRLTVEPAE
ncbi:TldD/PmbA family protein [Archangium sp.]|uniref:TldD/PmbA family protein n=1 Tax=Archangium sp. TaxID=1872627 RepID=UPI002ED77F98